MKVIVDANVLSEGSKPKPDIAVLKWLRQNEKDIVVNPIILGEMEFGILRLADGQRKTSLMNWFRRGVKFLPVIEIDAMTAHHWAALLTELQESGYSMPIKDSLIAASARQHRFKVATRNLRDFQHAGVELIDPFGPTGRMDP